MGVHAIYDADSAVPPENVCPNYTAWVKAGSPRSAGQTMDEAIDAFVAERDREDDDA